MLLARTVLVKQDVILTRRESYQTQRRRSRNPTSNHGKRRLGAILDIDRVGRDGVVRVFPVLGSRGAVGSHGGWADGWKKTKTKHKYSTTSSRAVWENQILYPGQRKMTIRFICASSLDQPDDYSA